jgi:hypothetical protein
VIGKKTRRGRHPKPKQKRTADEAGFRGQSQQIKEEVFSKRPLGPMALPLYVFSSLRSLRLCVSFLVLKLISCRGAESAEDEESLEIRVSAVCFWAFRREANPRHARGF